ncbi:hypothetical protein PT190_00375 [Erysipelothrix rhusiopathiae]|uniref:hypothetical protein n=1 Tax=Erysipelothrix rhusiopathiae TaxID=1648 RepID=UPI0023B1F622|nr:hypothetical protein [Erysipelothrix rhusiopathiae]MDE8294856.1 hypothetical protein [Erysipelothrix rhusiopathiae]MDE9419648.1 hypothetical protein [Erysipelothrix rhusiopathiae]
MLVSFILEMYLKMVRNFSRSKRFVVRKMTKKHKKKPLECGCIALIRRTKRVQSISSDDLSWDKTVYRERGDITGYEGKASLFIDRINKRRDAGLATPKQIRLLERFDFQHVGSWSFEAANKMISRIAAQGWRQVPPGIEPRTYKPEF